MKVNLKREVTEHGTAFLHQGTPADVHAARQQDPHGDFLKGFVVPILGEKLHAPHATKENLEHHCSVSDTSVSGKVGSLPSTSSRLVNRQ
jgi:hypothetical protein